MGSVALGQQLQQQLQKQGLNPTVIPVGGSNSLGTWGYLEAAQELASQKQKFTDIVMVGGPLTQTLQLLVGSSACRHSSVNAWLLALQGGCTEGMCG